MSQGRRFAAIVVLFLLGWSMIALADALDAWWPLFVATLPLAAIPWIIVRHEREVAAGSATAAPAAEPSDA